MSFLLAFSTAYGYAGPDDSITLPVLLRAGNSEVEIVASLDTGASYCLFDGWLDRVKIGIVDHDQALYAAGYDEPIVEREP